MIKTSIYEAEGEKQINMYTLESGLLSVDIVERGARINAIRVGRTDVALGFKSFSDYKKSGMYAGATVGRVANRIEHGEFTLNGKKYTLAKNNGNNHLHGGDCGFDSKDFALIESDENSVTLAYVSKDGEEGYPGTLTLRVKYTIKDNALIIEYSAASDADTLWSPTNHTYFNLDGEGEKNCLSNVLKINADKFTPSNAELIPLGTEKDVDGVMDFRKGKPIGRDIADASLKNTFGYDHNYVLSDEFAAEAFGEKTGIGLKLFTDLPCMQLYSGGCVSSETCHGKTHDYGKHAGFCLEPQYAPNAVNVDAFTSPILKKGEIKRHYIRYEFFKK